MNWKNQIAIRILLFLARVFADTEWTEELKNLCTHIQVEMRTPQQEEDRRTLKGVQ